MSTSASSFCSSGLVLCEDSIRINFGEKKLSEIKTVACKFEKPFQDIKKAGIQVFVAADRKNLYFELKDKQGKIISGGRFENHIDCSSYLLLGSAITRSVYTINKRLSKAIQLLKA